VCVFVFEKRVSPASVTKSIAKCRNSKVNERFPRPPTPQFMCLYCVQIHRRSGTKNRRELFVAFIISSLLNARFRELREGKGSSAATEPVVDQLFHTAASTLVSLPGITYRVISFITVRDIPSCGKITAYYTRGVYSGA